MSVYYPRFGRKTCRLASKAKAPLFPRKPSQPSDGDTVNSGVLAIFIIVGYVIRRANRKRTAAPPVSTPPGLFVIGARVILLTATLTLALMAKSPAWWSCACFGWVLMPLYAVPLAVRSGMPRVAHAVTRISHLGTGRALAVFNELRAFAARARTVDRKKLRRRVIVLFDLPTDNFVRHASVASLALLDALLGDPASARALFRVIQDFGYPYASRSIRTYAQVWLLADAANRGSYAEVVELSYRGPITFQRRYFRARALHHLRHAPAPSRWLEAGAWLVTPLLRYRLGPSPKLDNESVRPELTIPPELPGVRQVTFDALRLNPGQITRSEVRNLAAAWQSAFESGEVLAHVTRQAEQVDALIDADAAVARIEDGLVEALAELWQHSLPDTNETPPNPPLLEYAKDRLQSELLDDIQSVVGRLPHGKDQRPMLFEHEWRAWAQLRAKLTSFETMIPERAEQLVHTATLPILNYGAWLYNSQNARALSNEIFRWLLKRYPKDHVDYKTVKRNVRISANA